MLDEARRLAQEALELSVSGLVEDGEELPARAPCIRSWPTPENSDAVTFLVALSEAADRTVRVNITSPERLFCRIDESVKNRSAFWASSAEKALAEG